MKKNFILDTSVILNDTDCIYGFDDNDIIIPSIVLEELDNIKVRNDTVGHNARVFIRKLEELISSKNVTKGIKISENKGLLYILKADITENILNHFKEDKADHRLLSIADTLKDTSDFKNVALVTMDINLRVKARSIGIVAEDYKNSKIENVSSLYDNIVDDTVDDALIKELYEKRKVPRSLYKNELQLINNQYLTLKSESSSVLCYYCEATKELVSIQKKTAFGIIPKNVEQTFAMDALLRDDIKLVALTGVPGGGKTLLALAAALTKRKDFKQIFLSRPIIALMDKDLGYLPGKAEDKVNPYMKPLYDNLHFIQNNFKETSENYKKITTMLETNKINIEPLAYLRGRSINKVFYIIDESQNLSSQEIKTIITRAGQDTKIVFTGDIEQIDVSYLNLESNGLSHLIDKMKGESLFAHIDLRKGERSYLAELAAKKL